MKRCWLHIGMHKTGSSSVQHNLAKINNPSGWRLFSIGGRPNMGPALHAMVSREPHKCHWFSKTGEGADEVTLKGGKWREELTKAIADLTEENFIISAEALSTFSKKDIETLRDFLAPLCDEIRVIGYVRPPIAFKTSRFQENVKHGNGVFNIADIKLNYRSKFEKFDMVFGRSNVILRKFDPAAFPNRCLVADFCQETGIVLPTGTRIRRINESLSREACGILYAYRKFGSGYGVGKDVIKENIHTVKPLLATPGAKFKVSMSIIDPALALEKKDIEWMEKRLGVSLAEPDFDENSGVSSEEELLTVLQATCTEYAAQFRKMYGVDLPAELIPTADPVDPVQVARLVEASREICREIIQNKRSRIANRKKQSGKSILSRIKRLLRKRNL